MSDETAAPQDSRRPEEDILLDLNFVPQWARHAPAPGQYGSGEGDSPEPRSRRSRPRREGPPRRGGRAEGGERPSRPRRPRAGEPEREMPPAEGVRRERTPRRDEAPVRLPVEIKFLPEQQRLASMVRQIHHSKRAYPLMDLAGLFLSDPKGHMVKIEAAPGAEGFKLYQGRRSKAVALSREALVRRLMDEHLDSFFTREEIETEPPAGAFPCIAKIGDLLLGPPNHHSYAARLQEIHQTRYASLPFERFKEKIQTVRDEELIARWKQEASRKTVYRLKESPEGEAREFTRSQAENYIRDTLAEAEIEELHRAVIPGETARQIKDPDLLRTIREAWEREHRFPLSLSFALRAAFRHLHLHTFKAGGNINFITAVKPDPVAPDQTAAGIRAVLEFLELHPGSTREQLLEGLRPGAAKDSPEAHEVLQPLRWLIEKGHLIEFFNGTLAVPAHRKRR